MNAPNFILSILFILFVLCLSQSCEQISDPPEEETPIQIAYLTQFEVNGSSDIIRVNADGSNRLNLTDSPASEFYPIFTPDGEQLVYWTLYNSPFDDLSGLYIMNADGTGRRCIMKGIQFFGLYELSPDGSMVAMRGTLPGDTDRHIYVINIDGSNPRPISSTEVESLGNMRFSPDASQVIFDGILESNPNEDLDIFVVDVMGQNQMRLTSDENDEQQAQYTPDGEKIIYKRKGTDGGLYIMNADGSDQQFLLQDSAAFADFDISPDGTSIVYHFFPNGIGDIDRIEIADIDGSNIRVLVEGLDANSLSFSSDGAHVLFASGREGIFIVDVASGELIQLTTNEFRNSDPVFRPN